MGRIVTQFNPTDFAVGVTSGVKAFPATMAGSVNLILKNKSIVDVILNFPNGDSIYVESGIARRYEGEFNPQQNIVWRPVPSNGYMTSSASARFMLYNVFIVEAYEEDEEIVESYPCLVPIRSLSVQDYAVAGLAFRAITQRQNAAAANNFPMSVFNPGPNTLIIFSIVMFAEGSTNFGYFLTSADPSYANACTIIPLSSTPLAQTTAHCTFKNANETTAVSVWTTKNNDSMELLTNGSVIVLPGFDLAGVPIAPFSTPGGLTIINSLNAAVHYGMAVSYLEVPQGGEII